MPLECQLDNFFFHSRDRQTMWFMKITEVKRTSRILYLSVLSVMAMLLFVVTLVNLMATNTLNDTGIKLFVPCMYIDVASR